MENNAAGKEGDPNEKQSSHVESDIYFCGDVTGYSVTSAFYCPAQRVLGNSKFYASAPNKSLSYVKH